MIDEVIPILPEGRRAISWASHTQTMLEAVKRGNRHFRFRDSTARPPWGGVSHAVRPDQSAHALHATIPAGSTMKESMAIHPPLRASVFASSGKVRVKTLGAMLCRKINIAIPALDARHPRAISAGSARISTNARRRMARASIAAGGALSQRVPQACR